ncbi:cytochrome c-type biogenesis protein [Roseibium suaedae]|uniref:Cytochrome c-type biogenesis protein n=1 Tax=Roseibium suaedae TaxID=735517 RepID=A0A1M7CEU0_9HYPH|nr:cytochrome c-type biogenesis protein [Roseibium suaedae]SHL65717.1 cytochrome c-type biogenesis protein CcmH [Roseibium suaedae]
MRQLRTLTAAFGLLLASLAPVLAVAPDEVLKDPVLEGRARELSAHLRCMVCQNQSIDDSDAPLAKDLRILVRERLVAGDSDEEVVDYLVSRYGEFVLLKPRFAWHTAILWFAPLVALIGGLVGLFLAIRKRSAKTAEGVREVPLTEEEEERLIKLLDKSGS